MVGRLEIGRDRTLHDVGVTQPEAWAPLLREELATQRDAEGAGRLIADVARPPVPPGVVPRGHLARPLLGSEVAVETQGEVVRRLEDDHCVETWRKALPAVVGSQPP